MSKKREGTPPPENGSNKKQKLSTPIQPRQQADPAQQAINVLATMGNPTYRGLDFTPERNSDSSPDGNAGKSRKKKSRRKSRKKSKRKKRAKPTKKRRRTRVKKR